MTDLQTVERILDLAATLGPTIAKGIEAVLSDQRPELLPAPPPRADAAIRAEDEEQIRKRFSSDD